MIADIVIYLAMFIILSQIVLILFGGWLINFVYGIVTVLCALQYFNMIAEGLYLGYLIPLIMVVLTIMLWISALMRKNEV